MRTISTHPPSARRHGRGGGIGLVEATACATASKPAMRRLETAPSAEDADRRSPCPYQQAMAKYRTQSYEEALPLFDSLLTLDRTTLTPPTTARPPAPGNRRRTRTRPHRPPSTPATGRRRALVAHEVDPEGGGGAWLGDGGAAPPPAALQPEGPARRRRVACATPAGGS